jgi:hypothetical protein
MIRVTCPSCEKTLSAPAEKAGRIGKCVCGERILLPAPIIENPPPAVPPAAPTVPEAAPSSSRTQGNNALIWFIVPLVGVAGIALGIVVALFLMKGNQQGAQQANISNQATPAVPRPTPPKHPAPDEEANPTVTRPGRTPDEDAAMQECWQVILKRITDDRSGPLRERIRRQKDYRERLARIGTKEMLVEEAAVLLSFAKALQNRGNPHPDIAREVRDRINEIADEVKTKGFPKDM